MKIHTRELMLAALQLALASFIAGAANAQSPQQPQQMERLEELVRAQAAQIEKLSAEMKAAKKGQSNTSRQVQTAPQYAHTPPQQPKPGSQQAKPSGPPVFYSVAYTALPPTAKTPGAVGSSQYPNCVYAGDKPLSWKLPGSDINMQIGGIAKLDAHRNHRRQPPRRTGAVQRVPDTIARNASERQRARRSEYQYSCAAIPHLP